MNHMVLNIHGAFTAVLNVEAKEVMVYDPRFKGEAERGARRQDAWTQDGQFVASITTDELIRRGDHRWNMVGGVDRWTLDAAQVRYLRTWVRGVLADGRFPTGDGTSFIANRHVYSGPAGYVVRERGETFSVMSFTASGERVVGPFGMSLSRDDAYALAATLADGR